MIKKKKSDSIPYFILNEAAVKKLEYRKPSRKEDWVILSINKENYNTEILSEIVKDYHIEGFNSPIRPMVMTISNNVWFASF